MLGAQYYGKASVKRGVSAAEREFDAARKAGAECLAYVRNVAKRDKIVNALVHRNWHSSASVEIRLFADRLEIWSPGHLPPDITIPELYEEHESHPVNKEILKAFEKINAMESLGSGIARIIGPCRKVGLPTPLFEHRGAVFVVTILKNRRTKAALSSLGLNERQIAAVEHVKNTGPSLPDSTCP